MFSFLLGYETSLVCVKYAVPSVTGGVQHLPIVQEKTWPAGNVAIAQSL